MRLADKPGCRIMKNLKQSIWDMIECPEGSSKANSVYDVVMLIVILLSMAPLLFSRMTPVLEVIDYFTVTIFIIDYLLRWFTAALKLKRGWASYLLYPITPMALLDLLCILPSFNVIAGAFRVLKIARIFRTLRVFRSIRIVRKSKSISIFIEVIRKQSTQLVTVLVVAAAYIFVCAMVMYNLEPEIFSDFFHAIYWATVSLTTIGYGDIVPTSTIGQMFTILSAFVGIAVIALPSGIIAGGFMEVVKGGNNNKEEQENGQKAEETD